MNTMSLVEMFPVGEHLADELEARGWSQADLADILDRPKQFVSEIITGKKELTRESASQLAAAFGTSAEYWLNLQDSYHLWIQSQDQDSQDVLAQVRLRAKLKEIAPISLLKKRGFITSKDAVEQASQILSLFEKTELSDPSPLRFAARRGDRDKPLSLIQETWAACVRKIAKNLESEPYNHDRFEAFARECAIITSDPSRFSELQGKAAESGVKLVYLETFPGSRFDGCAMELDGNPVIGVSGRGKRLDKVLFTILHEAAHILLGHTSEEIILDDLNGQDDQIESEADALAASFAIHGDFPSLPKKITGEWINSVAIQYGVHPIVIVGRLQKEGHVSWNSSLAKNAPKVDGYLASWEAPKT